MGTLIYDGRSSIPLDDRTLAHLQVVILAKLRRRESFGFTAVAQGREVAMWLSPSVALEFVYGDRRRSAINREWLEVLAARASSMDGLIVLPEPEPAAVPAIHPSRPQPARRPSLPDVA